MPALDVSSDSGLDTSFEPDQVNVWAEYEVFKYQNLRGWIGYLLPNKPDHCNSLPYFSSSSQEEGAAWFYFSEHTLPSGEILDLSKIKAQSIHDKLAQAHNVPVEKNDWAGALYHSVILLNFDLKIIIGEKLFFAVLSELELAHSASSDAWLGITDENKGLQYCSVEVSLLTSESYKSAASSGKYNLTGPEVNFLLDCSKYLSSLKDFKELSLSMP